MSIGDGDFNRNIDFKRNGEWVIDTVYGNPSRINFWGKIERGRASGGKRRSYITIIGTSGRNGEIVSDRDGKNESKVVSTTES